MTASSRALGSATVRVMFAGIVGIGALASTLAAQSPQDSTRARLKEWIRATSPALESRRAALGTAQARRMAAGLSSPAVLSAEVEEVPGVANVLRAQSMRVDLGRELLPRARRDAERAIAESDVERARIELEVASAATDLLIDQLVVRAGGAAAIAARLASEDSLLRGAEEALRARFAVADARYVDVLRLRTERLRVETERHRARADYRVARGQLLRLSRLDTLVTELADASIALEASLALSGAAPPPHGLDSAAALSGALRLAALDVQRAEATRRLVRSELRPVMSPSIGMQRFGEAGSGSSIGLTAGVSISLPFTARRATSARSTVADQEVAFARAQQLATQASLATALATAHDRYEAAREQIASFDAALLRGARDEREAALAAYRTGGMTLLELLDFERALAQAEVTRIRSRVDAAEALVQYLGAALGLERIGGAS